MLAPVATKVFVSRWGDSNEINNLRWQWKVDKSYYPIQKIAFGGFCVYKLQIVLEFPVINNYYMTNIFY